MVTTHAGARLILFVAVSAGVLSCASGPKRPEWTRPAGQSVEHAVLNRDDYECRRETTWIKEEGFFTGPALAGPRLNRDLFKRCMRARGWIHEDD